MAAAWKHFAVPIPGLAKEKQMFSTASRAYAPIESRLWFLTAKNVTSPRLSRKTKYKKSAVQAEAYLSQIRRQVTDARFSAQQQSNMVDPSVPPYT
jgi:hypothetical protein